MISMPVYSFSSPFISPPSIYYFFGFRLDLYSSSSASASVKYSNSAGVGASSSPSASSSTAFNTAAAAAAPAPLPAVAPAPVPLPAAAPPEPRALLSPSPAEASCSIRWPSCSSSLSSRMLDRLKAPVPWSWLRRDCAAPPERRGVPSLAPEAPAPATGARSVVTLLSFSSTRDLASEG